MGPVVCSVIIFVRRFCVCGNVCRVCDVVRDFVGCEFVKQKRGRYFHWGAAGQGLRCNLPTSESYLSSRVSTLRVKMRRMYCDSSACGNCVRFGSGCRQYSLTWSLSPIWCADAVPYALGLGGVRNGRCAVGCHIATACIFCRLWQMIARPALKCSESVGETLRNAP